MAVWKEVAVSTVRRITLSAMKVMCFWVIVRLPVSKTVPGMELSLVA